MHISTAQRSMYFHGQSCSLPRTKEIVLPNALRGFVYYVGTRMEEAGLFGILDKAAADAAVESVGPGTEGLEVVCRRTQESKIYFVMNLGEKERQMPSWLCNNRDLLSGKMVTDDTVLKKYDVYIIQIQVR